MSFLLWFSYVLWEARGELWIWYTKACWEEISWGQDVYGDWKVWLKGAGLSLACVQISTSNSGNKPTKQLWETKQGDREGPGAQGSALMGACLSFEQLLTDFSETES